jgi:hypothetical protein
VLRARLPLLLTLLLCGTASASAQGVQLDVLLPPPAQHAREAPFVRSGSVLAERRTRDLLHNGFPVRLQYRIELWSTRGWFNSLQASESWEVIVRFSPLERRYQVARVVGERVTDLGSFDDVSAAEFAISAPFQPGIRPPSRRDRHYYNVLLTVSVISVSDLDEVERWLRGELRPAVRGQRNPGTAVTRGVRILVVRLLGSETRQYEARSASFRPQ